MNWPLGRLGAAATLGQHCPQMTQRRCTIDHGISRPVGPLAHGQEGMQLCRYYTTLLKKGNVCLTMAAMPKG